MKLFEDEELYSLREIADKLKMAYNTVVGMIQIKFIYLLMWNNPAGLRRFFKKS